MNVRDIVKAGQQVTVQDLKKLEKLWIEVYLTLMIITSPSNDAELQAMKDKLAEANEAVSRFFSKHLTK